MPELPEVETIRRQLHKALEGKKIAKIEVLRDKSFDGDPNKPVGWEVDKVDRKAKLIEIYFKKKEYLLIVHLKMTGQLVFVEDNSRIVGGHPTSDWVKSLPSKHTRVIIYFKDESKLFFNDMRVFGWIRMVEKQSYENTMRKTVPDVTDKEFTLEYFDGLLKKTTKAIKLLIMDQEKIGGIGNIYANDALYLAKVRPNRKANSLNKREKFELLKSIKEVINKGIKYGGASAANYVDTKGLGGTYQDHFLVYKKDGQNCNKCGSKILKMKIGGRGTYYCPKCQQ